MFRRKKKEINSTLRDSIYKSFDRSLDDDHEAMKPTRIRPPEMPLRKDGVRNGQIDHDMLMALPPSWRKFWTIIDLDTVFGEERLERTAPEPTELMKISETEPDLLAWQKEKRLKLKAITLGELSRKEYDKIDFGLKNRHEKSNKEYADDNQRGN